MGQCKYYLKTKDQNKLTNGINIINNLKKHYDNLKFAKYDEDFIVQIMHILENGEHIDQKIQFDVKEIEIPNDKIQLVEGIQFIGLPTNIHNEVKQLYRLYNIHNNMKIRDNISLRPFGGRQRPDRFIKSLISKYRNKEDSKLQQIDKRLKQEEDKRLMTERQEARRLKERREQFTPYDSDSYQ